MSTSVTKNISEISISQPTHTLTIINNNTGNIVTVTPSNNPNVEIQAVGATGGQGPPGIDGEQGPPGIVTNNSGVIVSGSIFVSGSGNVDFSLSEGGVTGSFSGSFFGNGSGITNIPSTSIVGLNLSQISSGTATASISQNSGLFVNTNITSSGNISSSGIVKAFTGSFGRLEGLSPITIGSPIIITQAVTGSVFSGSFVGDGSTLLNITAPGTLSGSAQIASNISGSFTSVSSSLGLRITNLKTDSGSFSTRITANELITTKTLISGSAQIASNISGSFTSPSSSISSRITFLEGGGAVGFTASGISGSLGPNAVLIRSLTAVKISGSFTNTSSSLSSRITSLKTDSGSFSTRVASLEGNDVFTSAMISGSLGTNAELIRSLTATKISGSFTAPSSSISTRVTSLEANPVFTSAMISGSFNASSASFSTRTTVLESNPVFTSTIISGSFNAPSASFSTRVAVLENNPTVTPGTLSGSAQIAANISGSFVAPSASFSTRISNLKTDSGSFSTRTTVLESNAVFTSAIISGSFTAPSSSFSTRTTVLESNPVFSSTSISGSLGPNATLIRSLTATSISESFIAPSASFSTRTTILETNPVFSSTMISGSFVAPSSSISTRITFLEEGGAVGFTSGGISGSLGANAVLIRSLTATGISGSFIAPSASFSTRVASLENNPTVSVGTLSSSAQIASEISGAFNDTSSSLGSRTTALEANPVFTSTMISGSFTSVSSSITSRITSNRSLITDITSSLITTGRVVFTTANGGLGTEEGFEYNTTTNQLTVDSLNVLHLTSSFITASSIKTSGSNIFGDDTSDTQTFIGTSLITGSAHITGSLGVSNNIKSIGTIIGSNLSGTNTGDQDLSILALKSSISGSFTAPSSSISSRITFLEEGGAVGFTATGISGSLGPNATLIRSLTATSISGSSTKSSASFSTRTTALEANPVFTSTMISGSFIAPSSSLSTRVTFLEEGGAVGFTASGISGSLGANAVLIRSLTSTSISGSFIESSASFSTRVASLENNPTVSAGTLSGSAQIATEISGAFNSPSSSLSTRVTSLEANPVFTSTMISGSFVAPSSSFSNRVTTTALLVDTNTNKIDSIIIVTGSYAITGSNNFIGDQNIVGSLTISSSIYRTAIISSTIANITQSIHNLSTSSFDGAFIEYTAVSASNARAGNIMSVWDGTNITFAETTTTDIGDTSNLLFQVALTQSVAQIQSYTTSTGYRLKTIIKAI